MAEAKEQPGNREVTGVFMRPFAREIFLNKAMMRAAFAQSRNQLA
jgi:hypothetical protein